ncbi:hypothetical protein SAMN06265379_101837 [Saccharicrinis carchari]|uniref:Uncharacterized protein n=1 Tax=Saccharicrinis carchari TaxID=1168039 RepID=A0A521BAW7_SACCC|nr:hypothetical protein SAMN06265379_101837 [Saccharicrinis carchari]
MTIGNTEETKGHKKHSEPRIAFEYMVLVDYYR